jgi:hypothetical protein
MSRWSSTGTRAFALELACACTYLRVQRALTHEMSREDRASAQPHLVAVEASPTKVALANGRGIRLHTAARIGQPVPTRGCAQRMQRTHLP